MIPSLSSKICTLETIALNMKINGRITIKCCQNRLGNIYYIYLKKRNTQSILRILMPCDTLINRLQLCSSRSGKKSIGRPRNYSSICVKNVQFTPTKTCASFGLFNVFCTQNLWNKLVPFINFINININNFRQFTIDILTLHTSDFLFNTLTDLEK